jgi:hypothetical protein
MIGGNGSRSPEFLFNVFIEDYQETQIRLAAELARSICSQSSEFSSQRSAIKSI